MAELRGNQVVLTQVADADVSRLRAIHAAPEVAAWWGPVPENFPFSDDPGSQRLSIRHQGAVVGLVQFTEETEPDYRHAAIDIFLDPACHGQGLGADAIRTVLAHLFETRGHHRVTIDPAAHNQPAIRCYEKVGFRRVGVLHSAWRDSATGAWRDVLLMELVRTPRAS